MTNRRSAAKPAKPPAGKRRSDARGVRVGPQLERGGVSFLGPARIDLLEAIGARGSITQAAKTVGLRPPPSASSLPAQQRDETARPRRSTR